MNSYFKIDENKKLTEKEIKEIIKIFSETPNIIVSDPDFISNKYLSDIYKENKEKIENPKFYIVDEYIHSWEGHVDEELQLDWHNLSAETKAAIYANAERAVLKN